MSYWLMMVKKDIRILRTRWLISAGIIVAIGIAVGVATDTGAVGPGMATLFAAFLVIANLFVLPANLFRGLTSEMRRAPSLWLQTPQSGWAMFASKLASSLIGALMFLVITYLLSLWMFQLDLGHVTSALMAQHLGDASILLNQIPRLEFYTAIALLFLGLYIAMWVSTAYMCVRAVKNHLRKFSWLMGVAVVLIATWGLGAFENTTMYEWLFGWGQFSALSLFPPEVQAIVSTQGGAYITTGHVVSDVIVIGILFYITGRLIDRHVEV